MVLVNVVYFAALVIQASWALESHLRSPPYDGPPKVTISEPKVDIVLKDTRSLTCVPEGSPLPKVQWAKANGEFRDGVKQEGNSLVISDARQEDEGHYLCRGIVEGTTVWTDYSVIHVAENSPTPKPAPAGPPRVTVSEREVNITEGENRTITCTPEGFPLPTVQWIQAEAYGEFREGVVQEGNNLIITDAREEDDGYYYCFGIVEETAVGIDYSEVQVLEKTPTPPAPGTPPRVTVSEQGVNITEGENRTITCTPEGFPLPTVQWGKASGKFRDGVIQDGNSLVITDAREEDEGYYYCFGIVGETTVWIDYSEVEVLEKPAPTPPAPAPVGPPTVNINEKEVNIMRGENATITCSPGGLPLPKVQWAKADGEFRIGVTQEGNTLIIRDAREEDAGHYLCRGIVEGTTVWTDYSVIRVVEKPPPTTPAPAGVPKVTVSEREVNITEGENRTITCTPGGSPLPTVQWEKTGGKFGDGVTQDGNNLIISNAQKEDAGVYWCRGLVEKTSAWIDYSIVHVNEKPPPTTPAPAGVPKVTVSEREVNITEGENRTITCTPGGSPLPTVQWEKTGGKFGDGVKQDGNNLIISNAQKEDAGVYWCRGLVEKTSAWIDYSIVHVNDKPPQPPKVSVSARTVKIPEGQSASITCAPEGSPLPIVWWTKSNGKFRSGVKQSGNALIIPVAQAEDQGLYVCNGLVNGKVVSMDYSIVEIVDNSLQPPKVSVSARTVKIREGESGSITCSPEGSPLPIVWWIKSNGKFRFGVKQSGNALIIPVAQAEDRGLYVCNGLVNGKVVSMDYSIVEIVERSPQPPPAPNGPPTVAVSEREVKVLSGGAKTLNCIPKGTPLPKVLWAKANGDFRDGVRQDGNSLIIMNAQKDDQAHYVCKGIVEGTVVWTDYSKVEVVGGI